MPKTKFPAVIELSSLNGKNGFKMNGEIAGDQSGVSVSHAGDVNGDGVDDWIIGACYAGPDGRSQAGYSYVIFGRNGIWPSLLELSTLEGTTGFKINGEITGDYSGYPVSYAGDINGDGIDDLIVGASVASPDGRSQAGSSYVIFGHNGTWPSLLELSALEGIIGFKINGEMANDRSGYPVSHAGDINGDGFDDLIIGARFASPAGKSQAGSSYVIFGRNGTWPSSLELSTLDGAIGFKINGEMAYDYSGYSVSYAGDINGDGIDDLIIGAYAANPDGKNDAGSSYIIFGHNGTWPSLLELSAVKGTTGFKINGEVAYDYSGISVSNAGDINGDDIDDLIISAYEADPDGRNNAGISYVVFGHYGTWPDSFELSALDGTTGFKINGEMAGDKSGHSVSVAGDINGDGINDLILSAYEANPGGKNNAGSSYVIFGHNGTWPSLLELSALDGTIGFKINGEMSGDYSGFSVSSAGDINGDGIDDLIIGAHNAAPNGKNLTGSSYVIFGDIFTAELIANQLTINEGMTKNITLSNLDASDNYHNELWFAISALEHGYFENINDVGNMTTIFSKQDIENNAIRFVHDGSEFPPAYNITIYTEKLACSEPFTTEITFTPVNDVPELTVTFLPLHYLENEIKAVDSNIVITDPDNADLVNATITITHNFYDDQDILKFVDQNGISGHYDNVTGILTLTGVSSVEHYQMALRNVTYQNLFEEPTIEIRTVTFVANDGIASSLPATRDINVISVNDAPVIVMTDAPLEYIENDPATIIDSGLMVFDDPDNLTFVSATISIVNNFNNDQDILGVADQNNITSFYYSETGILMLTGTSSENNYQTALRWVTYENLSDDPIIETRTIEFRVHDGVHESAGVTRDISIVAINDLPILTGSSSALSYTENSPATVIDNNIVVTDPDSVNLANATVAIINNFNAEEDVLEFVDQNGISGIYNNIAGMLSLTGSSSVNNYQNVLRSVKYSNPSNNPAMDIRSIAFIVNDGHSNSNTIIRSINIVPENDSPVLLNNCLIIEEGQNVTLTSNELSATDIDNDDADLEFTVNSVSRGRFRTKYASQEITTFAQRNISQGDIVFVHDGSNNAPSYFVRVSDGALTNVGGLQLADIDFIATNDIPRLVHNQITIYQGQNKRLTNTDLSAIDEETLAKDLTFIISDIQHGYFEDRDTPDEAITRFLQQRVMDAHIKFVHDGGNQAPYYRVSVHDGEFSSQPSSAIINFIENTANEDGSSLDNKIISACISGGIGLCFLVFKIYLNRKAAKSFKKLTEDSETDMAKRHANFYKNVVRPVSKAIFDRINIKECLGYISDSTMKSYLDAVIVIIDRLAQLGVHFDFETMNFLDRTSLINEIAKQTRKQLLTEYSCCSCGNLQYFLKSFCVSDVSPEEIENQAENIALAVVEALRNRKNVLKTVSQVNQEDIIVQVKEEREKETIGVVHDTVNTLIEMQTVNAANPVLFFPALIEEKPKISSVSNNLDQQRLLQDRMLLR